MSAYGVWKELGLPLGPERLAPIIGTGCLSLLDFVNLPTHLPYKPVASLVKACFGVLSGASEVIFHVLTTTSLDPSVRCLLSGLRLWFLMLCVNNRLRGVARISRGS